MSGFVSVHKKGSVKLGLTLGGIDAGFPCARKRRPSDDTLLFLQHPHAPFHPCLHRSPSMKHIGVKNPAIDNEREATRRLLLCRNDACYTLLVAIKRGMLPLASKPCKESKTNLR